MSLFEEACENLKGYSTPKQFAEPIEPIKVTATFSAEDIMRINHSFQEACNLIQTEECQAMSVMDEIVAGGDAEDCQSLSVMDKIVAGGPVIQKKLKKPFYKTM